MPFMISNYNEPVPCVLLPTFTVIVIWLTEFKNNLTVYDFRIYFKYKGHYKKETFISTTFILILTHIFCLIMHLAIC